MRTYDVACHDYSVLRGVLIHCDDACSDSARVSARDVRREIRSRISHAESLRVCVAQR